MVKRQLRQQVRTRIAALTAEARVAEEAAVVAALRRRLPSAGPVLLYAALPDELSVDALFDAVQLVLPRVVGDGEMALHAVSRPLRAGRWHIREPDPSDPVVAPEALAAAVIPGRAFDGDGYRLGRGGGFYDRMLLQTRAVRLGVGYACQRVEAVPREPHDVPVDVVITAAGEWHRG
jgi:5-formyltetrahydrofolate cyclo-ligase